MKDKQLLLAVLAQLEREKTVSIPQLAQLLGVSEEQVFEALEVLVFAYDAASIRLDLHDSYASLKTYGTERLLRLTAPEADALVDALLGAGFFQEDELVRTLLQAKSTIDEDAASSEPRMRVISQSGAPLIAQEISAACEDQEHHLLDITYQGMDDEKPETRCIEPVVIFSEEGHQYLLAYCRNVDGWRSFRLDRITAVAPLEESFTPREDIPTPRLALERDAQEAIIRFANEAALPQWRNLKIKKREDEGVLVGIPWTGSAWLPKHLVALMGEATPVSPESLVDACDEYAQSLLNEFI